MAQQPSTIGHVEQYLSWAILAAYAIQYPQRGKVTVVYDLDRMAATSQHEDPPSPKKPKKDKK